MPVNDELGKRMKTFYEQVHKTHLVRRTPVAIRIDGKSFHTFTRGFKKPFDEILIKSMQETAKYLCENIQGCVLAYTQSDEITLILVDYQTLESSAWFDYQVQKMCSISASMATMAFNKYFEQNRMNWFNNVPFEDIDDPGNRNVQLLKAYTKASERGAMFDARVFNIPKEEVTNLIYWRQLDATRNSIQMVGQANFSHTELHGKSCNDIQDMLFTQRGINWNDYPTHMKRGTCVVKKFVETHDEFDTPVVRKKWVIDLDIPIFKEEGRKYIDKLIEF
jgi:tRNA(His) 5'-end guanylyltransferase